MRTHLADGIYVEVLDDRLKLSTENERQVIILNLEMFEKLLDFVEENSESEI